MRDRPKRFLWVRVAFPVCVVALVFGLACRPTRPAGFGPAEVDNGASLGGPRTGPPCTYKENAFRAGVDPPPVTRSIEPDLSGLPPVGGERHAFVEVRIDEFGHVADDCMLRGIRTDVDERILAAVRAWQFAVPRLKFGAVVNGKPMAVGTPVPVIMTVHVTISR